MPVRDGGAYLAEAVDSILSQTVEDLELLVVDDHSEDTAIEALDRNDPRLKLLRSAGGQACLSPATDPRSAP